MQVSAPLQIRPRSFATFQLYTGGLVPYKQHVVRTYRLHGGCKKCKTQASEVQTLTTEQDQGQTVGVSEVLEPLSLPTSDESEEILRIRHSCAHIMAMAVQRLYKGTQVTIGPWIERGFYYDFDFPEAITDKDLKKIQKEMRRIVRKDHQFIREEISKEEAERRIREIGEEYKLEILQSIVERDPDAPITIYHIGEESSPEHWWDLCAGPHVESTGKIGQNAFQLEKIAGAYWRGDENRPMLTRIYGTAWTSEAQLKAYQTMLEEAARRDHKKLGSQLDLFSIQEDVGGGLVSWHPNGATVRNVIETFWKEVHTRRGYKLLYTPHVAKVDLWKTSGHFEFYGESMFDQMEIEDEEYQLRPMNCPFHISIYKDQPKSYRDFPIRWAELGTVYRYERSGSLQGLFRVRGFTQDDAHIFCNDNQIESEIRGVLDLVEEVMTTFGFNKYEVNLSTRPEKSVGEDNIWEVAEKALVQALKGKGWDYVIDNGGGAFYGPKIDIKIQDAIGRKWQCSTVQLDFNLPERFDMQFTDSENQKKRPIMIHRAILGSIERFFGILIENYAGAFPVWLAPVQCRILPVTDSVLDACNNIAERMRMGGIRAEVVSGERISKLIRNAEVEKIPVMAVVGAQEVENGTLSLRTYEEGDIGKLDVELVIQRLRLADMERTKF
eukprot:TRINITY_DN7661_c0_g2_i1.p1 TRINITY_DN7661_c0_g2~~TRINITY_DN7661_c0_g2_i1.p1  ORF type:complete len:705 (-),score=112.98 TRINITY_DN7661_c0_g2_i1:365-2362(-)